MYLLLFLPVYIISCNNSNSNKAKTGNTITAADSIRLDTAFIKPWYKRYTGTVAGQGVVVNLYQTARHEFRGTYSCNSKGILMELNSMNDSCRGNNLFLYETAPTERTDNNDYQDNPHWAVTISGDKITGRWISKDGGKTYPIELKEDYSGNALTFDVLTKGDTQKIKHGAAEVTNAISYLWSEPGAQTNKTDAAYALSVIKQKMGTNDLSLTISDLAAKSIKASFAEFKAGIGTAEEIGENDAYMFSQESNDKVWVNYNQNGFVVFEFFGYQYMGGAHGIYGSTFLCVDVQTKKVWNLKDIMHADTIKLMKIIEDEAHRIFNIPKDSALSNGLLVDTIPVTTNCYFTHTGITFNYVPYEIASFADGEVKFFIPFNRIMDMLTAEFKKRMKL
jgi:hypothetical protein